ncbi:hypothetical protein [Lysobacter gummosus]
MKESWLSINRQRMIGLLSYKPRPRGAQAGGRSTQAMLRTPLSSSRR